MIHFAPNYFKAPPHKITVDLIGLGGTGSQVLTGLARINAALEGLNHPGLHVTCYDPDQVSMSNFGRQLFAMSDLGENKAMVLTGRINRFFGTEWEAKPEMYVVGNGPFSNILITCIDSAAGRLEIGKGIKDATKTAFRANPFDLPYYWMDLGNSDKTGQVLLGSIGAIRQPLKTKGTISKLPTIIKQFPNLRKLKDKDLGPSCSLAEALHRQDLFINSTLAQFGCNLIWKLIREGKISMRGCYVNLEQMTVNPIPII